MFLGDTHLAVLNAICLRSHTGLIVTWKDFDLLLTCEIETLTRNMIVGQVLLGSGLVADLLNAH